MTRTGRLVQWLACWLVRASIVYCSAHRAARTKRIDSSVESASPSIDRSIVELLHPNAICINFLSLVSYHVFVILNYPPSTRRPRFGDLTKKTLSGLTDKGSLLSRTGQVLLGNETYAFGDLTRTKLEDAPEDWRGLERDPFNKIFGRAVKDLSPAQRKGLAIGLVQLAATALLTWGYTANVLSALALSAAWSMALLHTATAASAAAAATTASSTAVAVVLLPLLPFGPGTTETLWRTFLAKYASVNLFWAPLFLVGQGAGTLLWFRSYNAMVVKFSNDMVSEETRAAYPLLHKLGALLVTFVIQNVLLSTAIATCGMAAGGMWAR
jgi:hypothetical protein